MGKILRPIFGAKRIEIPPGMKFRTVNWKTSLGTLGVGLLCVDVAVRGFKHYMAVNQLDPTLVTIRLYWFLFGVLCCLLLYIWKSRYVSLHDYIDNYKGSGKWREEVID